MTQIDQGLFPARGRLRESIFPLRDSRSAHPARKHHGITTTLREPRHSLIRPFHNRQGKEGMMNTKTTGRCRTLDIGLVARATVATLIVTLSVSILVVAGIIAVGSVIFP